VMVALVITFPDLVGGGLKKKAAVDTDTIEIMVPGTPSPGGGPGDAGSLEDALSRALGGSDDGQPGKTGAPPAGPAR